MPTASLPQTDVLAWLMGRLGRRISVVIGSPVAPTVFARLEGTLCAGEDIDTFGVGSPEGLIVFGFEEHGGTFYVDPSAIDEGFAYVRSLAVSQGDIIIEVFDEDDD